MNRFAGDRKNNWERLEDLLSILDASSLRGLSRMEVREFGELYRRAATDLAIARSETRDPKLVNYLNSLVIRAHGKIYRAESQGTNLAWNFFTKDFPQTFRKNFRYFAIALV
nr:stage II sporulation protein M [Acidobacteriota bacterium]